MVARARATIYVSLFRASKYYMPHPGLRIPWWGRLPWTFVLLALQAASTTYVNWILYCKRLSQDFTQEQKLPCIPCVQRLKIGCA